MIAALASSPTDVSGDGPAPITRAHGAIADDPYSVASELRIAASDAHRLDVDGVQHRRHDGIVA